MPSRAFEDRPAGPQSPAARGRRELNINMLKRPFPAAADLSNKADFAASMTAEEHASFGDQHTEMLEDNFEEMTRNPFARKCAAGDILRGMLIRGRMQAAVFDVFMQLCRQGVCSLDALEHPVNWVHRAPSGTCLSWIFRMLAVFSCFRVDWRLLQESWGMRSGRRWFEYSAPMIWLATMIGRSFTSLEVVFDIIRTTNQLGTIHVDSLEQLAGAFQPDKVWEADINLNRVDKWHGSGTFAFWLPENIDVTIIQQGFDNAAMALSKDFYRRLERMEMHYAIFFDISRDTFDADVQQGERDVRDWVMDDAWASRVQAQEGPFGE